MENKSLKKQLDETCIQWGATEEVVVPVYGKVGQVPNGLLEDLENLANAHAMRVLEEYIRWQFRHCYSPNEQTKVENNRS